MEVSYLRSGPGFDPAITIFTPVPGAVGSPKLNKTALTLIAVFILVSGHTSNQPRGTRM